MLKMSFYNGTLDRNTAKDVVKSTQKKLMYRYGFGWKGAEKRPIEKESALNVIEKESFLDIEESEEEILLNAFSCNDML